MKQIFRSVLMIAMAVSAVSVVNAQGGAEQNQALAQARRATAKYHDLQNAIDDGYVLAPPDNCHGDANGAVGVSYIHVPRFLSQEVSELEPEFLNYIPTADGNMRLVSVAYGTRVLYRDTRPPNTPGYRPGVFAWQLPVIPAYLEEVSGPFTVFGEPGQGPIFIGRWIYLITVHMWAPNPLGMFAVGNPRLTCPE